MRKSFADRLAEIEDARPVFTGARGDSEAGYAYNKTLARMSDDGELEVLELIFSDEVPAFCKWCARHWK